MFGFVKPSLLFTALLSTSVGARWVEVGRQKSSKEDYFGRAVGMSERLLAVGAPYYTPEQNQMEAGIVKIYERKGESLELVQELVGEPFDQLGEAVAVSRGTKNGGDNQEMVIVGAPRASRGEFKNAGLAKVFYFSKWHAKWTQLGQDILGDNEDEFFGETVAISDDGMVICVGTAIGDGFRRGRVEIFKLNEIDSKWEEMGNPLFGDTEGEKFGTSISIEQRQDLSENDPEKYFLAIGAPQYDDGTGIVRTYHWDEDFNDWSELGEGLEGDDDLDHFGQSVSLGMAEDSMLYMSIGASSTAGLGEDAEEGESNARVQIFRYDTTRGENTRWVEFGDEIEELRAADGTGDVVELSKNGRMLALGASKFNNGDGAVRVYKYDEDYGDFLKFGETITGKNREGLGTSLSFSGEELAVGAPFQNYVKILKFDKSAHKKSGGGKFIINLMMFGLLGFGLFYLYKKARSRGFKWTSLTAALPGGAAISRRKGRTPVDTNESEEWPFGFFSQSDRDRIADARKAEEGRNNVDRVTLHGMPRTSSQDASSDSDSDGDDSFDSKQNEMRKIS
jgi:hypothetical protein